jgi:hypothetical protein
MYLYTLCRLPICTTRGILVHSCTNRGLMNRKNDRIESWFRYIPLENRCGGARGAVQVHGLYCEGELWYKLFGSVRHLKMDAPLF